MSVGEVVVERVQGVWVFTLRGEHDVSSEPPFQRQLEHAFDSGSTVVVDLSEVEFMDSSVLRALAYGGAQAARHPQHHIGIVAPPDSQARRLLAITGIDKHVSIWNTRDDALAAPFPA
jgi:anti-anti-sigma factor